jgi:hypothetical protein
MASGRSGWILANNLRIVSGQTSPEDALAAGNYPASGSYIDVSDCERVHCVVHLGAINAGDTPNFHFKVADAVDGTVDTVSSTALSIETANDDDDEYITWTVETRKLPVDHHFCTMVVADVTNGSYGDIIFLLEDRALPVTQSTSLLPAASQLEYVG